MNRSRRMVKRMNEYKAGRHTQADHEPGV